MIENIIYKNTTENIDWNEVPKLLEMVGMGFTTPELHKKSFEASYACIYVFDQGKLIGFGRIISDGVRQAAVYDVAISPEYQGRKIGKEIINRLVKTAPNCSFILYASVGKEEFYQKLGFSKMKTGMALFTKPDEMREKGFTE